MGIHPSKKKKRFMNHVFFFEKSQCKIWRHSKHGDIYPVSNSRIQLLKCDSRIDYIFCSIPVELTLQIFQMTNY